MAEPDPARERALVTGAAGFIGSSLLERLQTIGLELHALSRTHDPGEQRGVYWWQGDLTDQAALQKVFASVAPHVVFNLAGENRAARDMHLVRPTFEANLSGTVNVLCAAVEAGCRRVVLTGSLEEPDFDPGAIPSSPYAASKWAAGGYARMFSELYGLSVVCLRLFMVYGPGQRDVRKLIPYTILALLRATAPEVTSGNREIDWVYVDDVAAAYAAAAYASDLDGSAVDIGSGQLHSVREIVERLTQIVAPEILPRFGAIEDRPFEQVRVADTRTAFEQLGWRATTALDDGLARTVQWYESNLAAGTFS